MSALPKNVTPISPDNSGRDTKGRFASGPGNIGRPYGARSRHQRDFSQLLIAMLPRVAQVISDSLDRGERWSAELIARLMLPSGLTVPMHGVEVEDVETAIAEGDLSPAQADAIIALKKAGMAIRELEDHRAQLRDLIEKLAKR